MSGATSNESYTDSTNRNNNSADQNVDEGVDIMVVVTTMDGASTIEVTISNDQTVDNLIKRVAADASPAKSPKYLQLLYESNVLVRSSTLKAAGLYDGVQLTCLTKKARHAGLAKGASLGSVGTVRDLFERRSFTVEAWVRIHKFNGAGTQNDNAILGTRQYGPNHGLHLILRGGRPLLGFYCNDLCASKNVELNVWTHIAYVYDFDAQVQRIYTDGEPAGSRTGAGPILGSYEVFVGEWAHGGRYLNGEMGLLNIWDSALDADKIKESMATGAYEHGSTPAGLVKSLTFHESDVSDPLPFYRCDAVSGDCIALEQFQVAEITNESPF